MHTVGRWGLRVPDGTDGPPNVPLWMDRLAVDLTDVAKDNQGTLAARPTSTVLTPGVPGRYFTTTDEDDPAGVDRRRVYRDAGTAWDELATVPLSDRQVGAGALTEAKMATGANGLAKGTFRAYRSTAVSLATGNLVPFNAEQDDVSGWFDSTGNVGRFTPQVPGYYFLSAQVVAGGATDSWVQLVLRKIGAANTNGAISYQRGAGVTATVSAVVLAQGGTDYFDVQITHNTAGALALAVGAANTYFQGFLIGRV